MIAKLNLKRVTPTSLPRVEGPFLLGKPAAPPSLDEALSLGRMLEPVEHWRLFPDLGEGCVYLDIETTGLSTEDVITVVGISDGAGTSLLVRGSTLTRRRLESALGGARLLVTFAGSSFDVPRLRAAFPGLAAWDLPHFDLAIGGRQVGLRGGLKAIERQLGHQRVGGLHGLEGAGAPALWRAHEAGDPQALPRLLRYCRQDVESLVVLAPRIYRRLARRSAALQTGWVRRREEIEAASSSESARLPLPTRLVRTPAGVQAPIVDEALPSSRGMRVGAIFAKISAVARASRKAYSAIAAYSRRS